MSNLQMKIHDRRISYVYHVCLTHVYEKQTKNNTFINEMRSSDQGVTFSWVGRLNLFMLIYVCGVCVSVCMTNMFYSNTKINKIFLNEWSLIRMYECTCVYLCVRKSKNNCTHRFSAYANVTKSKCRNDCWGKYYLI